MGFALKIINFDQNSLGRHHLDLIVFLSKEEDILNNKMRWPLVVSSFYGLNMYKEKITLSKKEKKAIKKLSHIPIYNLKIISRMILTGCTEQEAFNYVGGKK